MYGYFFQDVTLQTACKGAGNLSLVESYASCREVATRAGQSLPTSPLFDGSVSELHRRFLALKTEVERKKDERTSLASDMSATSTELGPYMHSSQGNETSATTTPLVSCASDSESSSSLECSTPIKIQERVRKLSYTVLLYYYIIQ